MKKNIIDDPRMMLRVSDLYYNQSLSQQEIAKQLCLSRPTISKLLKAARDIGIVNITVSDITGRKHYQLEQHLEDQLGLKEVCIVDTKENYSDTMKAVGQATAQYLSHILKEGDTIGVSMGRGVASVAPNADPHFFSNLTFIPLIGGIGTVENDLHANNIAESLAKVYGGYYFPIHAPAMVTRAKTKIELMKENSIKRVFKKAEHLDIAMVGLGTLDANSTIIKTGYLTHEILDTLTKEDICGDICMNFYDQMGNIDKYENNQNVIGINIETLRKVPYSIAICQGNNKALSIAGAINGGYINVLVTDFEAATALNALAQQISIKAQK